MKEKLHKILIEWVKQNPEEAATFIENHSDFIKDMKSNHDVITWFNEKEKKWTGKHK